MFFRVFIPGVGNIFVQATNQQEALAAAQRYINKNQITIEPGAGDITAQQYASGSEPPGSTIIGADGNVISGSGTPQGTLPDPTPAPTPKQEQSTGQEAQPVDPEAVQPFGQFRNYLRSIGLDPDSPIGASFASPSRFNDIAGVHGLNQVLHNVNTAPVEGSNLSLAEQLQQFGGPQSLINFIQQQGNSGIATTALGGLQTLAGQGPGQENAFLAALQGATPGSGLGNILTGVASQALGTRLSPVALSLFGDQALDLAGNRYRDLLAGSAGDGMTAPSFASHLYKVLGLN